MRPIDQATARYHTDLSDERYHVDGRSKRLAKRFAKRKSSKAYRRALTKRFLVADGASGNVAITVDIGYLPNEEFRRAERSMTSMFLTARGLMSLAIVLLGMAAASQGWAASIRLDDNTTLTGDVLRVEDDRVIFSVPRKRVAAIDGTPLPDPLEEGMAAPAFRVPDMQGVTRSVGKGTAKVTLLHFWVHWCPHCRSDAPQMQALYDRYRDNPKVQILTVNLDEDRARVDQFAAEHHVTYPVIHAAGAAQGSKDHVNLPELYQITGFPATYLIDAQGIIRRKVSGSFVESQLDLGQLISSLLPAS